MQDFTKKIHSYWRLARFDIFGDTLLLLWPTLIALIYASSIIHENAVPDFKILLIFTFGVILMSAAGCVINDYADRNFDKHVERTKDRPLATEELKPKNALVFFVILISLAFALVLMTNTLTIILAFVGLALAIIYPFLKRYTYLPQLGLGIAFSWGVILAFSAVLNTVPYIAWVLLLANLFWILAFDTIYALDDLPYDKKIGVKSTAIFFGTHVKAAILLFHILAWSLFLYVGLHFGRGTIFIAIMLIAAIFIAHQHFSLRNATQYFPIFASNNYVGFLMLLAVILDFMYN